MSLQGTDAYGNPWFNPPIAASSIAATSLLTPQVQAGHVAVVAATTPTVTPEQDYISTRADWLAGGIDTANAITARDFVALGLRGTYGFPDGVTVLGSQTLTSAAGGGFTAALVGAAISNAALPIGTTITAVASANSITVSAPATASGTFETTITRNTVTDLWYVKMRGALPSTFGFAITPPDGRYRSQFGAAPTEEPAMGGVGVLVGPGQTGKAFAVYDSNPTDKIWIDKDFTMSGVGGITMKADTVTPAVGHVLTLSDAALSQQYSLDMPSGSGGVLRQRNTTNNKTHMTYGTDGSVVIGAAGQNIGAYGATAVAKPSVTGSRGGNAALASLLAALGSGAGGIGWITDNTTA